MFKSSSTSNGMGNNFRSAYFPSPDKYRIASVPSGADITPQGAFLFSIASLNNPLSPGWSQTTSPRPRRRPTNPLALMGGGDNCRFLPENWGDPLARHRKNIPSNPRLPANLNLPKCQTNT